MSRRVAAVLALASFVAAVVALVVEAVDSWPVIVVGSVSLSVAIVGGWYAVSRRGAARVAGVIGACVGLLALITVLLAENSLRKLALAGVLGAISVVAARRALSTPDAPADPATPNPVARAPRHPVLIMNLKSGGGKAERFDLVSQCKERGIESVVLGPGDDLLELAEGAVERGADLIGMAGGDGSQALVASVASRHGIPFVVIPAGTRNHFALDLGLDRDDVLGALDAYRDGVDRVIDLAEVNGRVFVNNASMGAYATIVQSEDYRDAKLKTAAALLPDILGPKAGSLDLRFSLPSGEEVPTGELLLVSNNAYELHHVRGGGTRERIDAGALGVVALHVRNAADANALAALEAVGQVQRFSGWNEWTAPEFEVRSDGPIDIGVDGEALSMQPPLLFRSLPAALTVRLPRTTIGVSPAARVVHVTSGRTIQQLWHVAVGEEPR